MFTSHRLAIALRASLLSTAALPFLAAPAQAQVAPTLLPYTVTALAGGGTAAIAKGATCPVSGFVATSYYGDGCLATEVQLSSPRFAVTDATGAVYFTDFGNGLVRRIDPISGVITTIAGGAATQPTAGSACGTNVALDNRGDGCLSTLVQLKSPTGLVFAPNGDLYIADTGLYNVRKIAATAGSVANGGIITNVLGYVGANPTFGYTSNNATTTINAATGSYSDAPYGLAIDSQNNLYVSEEFKNAIQVVNLNATGSTTVFGVTIPAGTVAKIAGAYPATNPTSTCPNGSSGTFGCSFGKFTDGTAANGTYLDANYGIALSATTGNLYVANEFNQNVPRITPDGIIHTFVGDQGSGKKTTARMVAGSGNTGSDFGVAVDATENVYFTDALNGVIWRVDSVGNFMYVVGGGATAVCSAATDKYGDGCPATQATFGSSQDSRGTFAVAANPGIYGVSVDASENLYVGDSLTGLVRKVSSGTQFGPVGANQPTQTVAVHFAATDGPSANPFSLTAGSGNFTLGAFSCGATNSDGTTDCTIAVTATPSVLGPFTGTLTVTSSKGAKANFALSGTYVTSPLTRTVLTYATGTTCATTTVGTTAPITLTATVASTGSPTGTVTFLANGAQIGTPVTLNGNKATLTYTFSTPGTYSLTAKYSGDSSFNGSTSTAASITSSTPSFTVAANSAQQSTVTAGQTALYSFTVTPSVYTGTISFACSGLPAYSTCSFTPATITSGGCAVAQTVALSIITQGANFVNPANIGISGPGAWQALGIVPGALLALIVGVRRRKSPLRYGRVYLGLALLMTCAGFTACSSNKQLTAATPAGTYTVNVTATGSAGTVTTTPITLTVK